MQESGQQRSTKVNSSKEPFFRSIFKKLGPGLITGASDDDPSGIATYSQVGARFGFGMLWIIILSYPLMAAIQQISGLIGRVTGRGIAGNLRKYYHPSVTYSIVGLMIVANVINIGADIAAMGSSLQMLIGGNALLYSAVFAFFSVILQIFIPYTKYVRYLKWLTLVLFSYVITAFIIDIPWTRALHSSFVPRIFFTSEYLSGLIAVLGTTISPYLFFWQASQEVEEIKTKEDEDPLKKAPEQADRQIQRIKIDTYLGMAFSNLIAYFIILAAAVTLNSKGIFNINTAGEAAEALRPLAGELAFLVFSMGIIGTGLLAIPVLSGSAAYAVGDAFRWRTGLENKPQRAINFYGVLAASTLLGLSLNFTPVNPIRALYWAAIINGITAVPVMVMMMLISSNKKALGQFTISAGLQTMGWISTIIMLLAAIGLFIF